MFQPTSAAQPRWAGLYCVTGVAAIGTGVIALAIHVFKNVHD